GRLEAGSDHHGPGPPGGGLPHSPVDDPEERLTAGCLAWRFTVAPHPGATGSMTPYPALADWLFCRLASSSSKSCRSQASRDAANSRSSAIEAVVPEPAPADVGDPKDAGGRGDGEAVEVGEGLPAPAVGWTAAAGALTGGSIMNTKPAPGVVSKAPD